jgi:FkbM family methyltransferase
MQSRVILMDDTELPCRWMEHPRARSPAAKRQYILTLTETGHRLARVLTCIDEHMPGNLNRLGRGFRKAWCALLPRRMWLRRRMPCGALVSGPNRAGFGGRGFFVFGEALEPELEYLHHFLRKDDVFMDVGANSGVFSMKAAACVGPGGLVVSVEPLPEMFCVLHRNVSRNGFGNVRIRNFAAGDRAGVTEFWINYGKPNSASLICHDPHARKYRPLSITLDGLAEMEKLERLDYLKIDAEGAEARILTGAADLINRFKPVIQVEEILEDAGNFAGYRKWVYPGSPNCLLVPEEHRLAEICRRLGYKETRQGP